MNEMSFKYLIICLSFMAIMSFNGVVESRTKDKIKLKDIQVLTLRPNEWTTGRRTKPVPQLKCVGGYCDAIRGQTVQCYNRGSDGVDIQWECQSNIDSGYKFGQMDVICEGYDYPEDDYVLRGSCGLEFTIDGSQKSSHSRNDYNYSPIKSKSNGFSFGVIVCLIFIIFVIYKTCLRPNGASLGRDQPRAQSPPPPGFRSDFFGNPDGCSSSTSSGFTGSTNERAQRNDGNTGFFPGLLTGGALGYLFGSRTATNYTDQSSYFGSRVDPSVHFPSGRRRSAGSISPTKGFAGTKRR